MIVNGLTESAEDGSVANSDESISSVSKHKKKIRNSDLSDSNSVDLYNSYESYRSTNMEYTQEDRTQLDPYQQGPLEPDIKNLEWLFEGLRLPGFC